LKCYAGKAGATIKSACPNFLNAVRYCYAGKTGATGKSAIPNPGNKKPLLNHYFFASQHPPYYRKPLIYLIQTQNKLN